MRCVDALSAGAIALLGAAIKLKPPRHASGGDVSIRPSELVSLVAPHDLHLLMSLASELRSLNLIHLTEGIVGSPSYENAAVRVTPMGVRFAQRFVEGRM